MHADEHCEWHNADEQLQETLSTEWLIGVFAACWIVSWLTFEGILCCSPSRFYVFAVHANSTIVDVDENKTGITEFNCRQSIFRGPYPKSAQTMRTEGIFRISKHFGKFSSNTDIMLAKTNFYRLCAYLCNKTVHGIIGKLMYRQWAPVRMRRTIETVDKFSLSTAIYVGYRFGPYV